jgi:ABC-2 type transport system ATP-binding protein/lipopolysaccharide transport system ATP-binding protein
MSLRLALAVSTCFEAEVLLLDEWIGAGDAMFLKRAHKRMSAFVERSSLLVMATHSPDLARSWCNKAALLDHGRIIAEGDVHTILALHESRQSG